MSLWLRIRRWWFEHQHRHLSRAWTLRHARTRRVETYVVCLDCGKEFEYDLGTMRLTGRLIRRAPEAPDSVAVEREYQDFLAREGDGDETETSNAGPAVFSKASGTRRMP
jgi:hypothetical protein